MAAEAASSGPRYAPEDLTLPQPWIGLIDGSTGVIYYWNPETNVTQYEKPADLPPPLPSGQPVAASTPTMAPLPAPGTTHTSDVQGHQMMQAQPRQPQQMNSVLQQQMQGAQQSNLQVGPNGQPHGSVLQQPGQPGPQQLRPQMQYLGQQMPPQIDSQSPRQPMQPMPQHYGQPNQIFHFGPVGNPQRYQFSPHQQPQYMPLQPNMPPQGQQNSHQLSHHMHQGQQYPYKQDQQVGFSPTQTQQSSSSSVQNFPAGTNHVQPPFPSVQPSQDTHFGGSSVMRQPISLPSAQQTCGEVIQQHGPRFQSQVGPGSIHDQKQKVPAFGSSMGYEGSPIGRAGNDYVYKSNLDGNTMAMQQQPKVEAIPMTRNVQEMQRGDLPPKNIMANKTLNTTLFALKLPSCVILATDSQTTDTEWAEVVSSSTVKSVHLYPRVVMGCSGDGILLGDVKSVLPRECSDELPNPSSMKEIADVVSNVVDMCLEDHEKKKGTVAHVGYIVVGAVGDEDFKLFDINNDRDHRRTDTIEVTVNEYVGGSGELAVKAFRAKNVIDISTLTEEEGRDYAFRALNHAVKNDWFTGGPIHVMVINSHTFTHHLWEQNDTSNCDNEYFYRGTI